MENKYCKLCNFEWVPRVDNPKSCPNCKSRKWNNNKLMEESEIDLEVGNNANSNNIEE